MSKKILTQDRIRELFYYCEDTGIFTRKTNAGGKKIGDVAGSRNHGPSNTYIQIGVDAKMYSAHRLVWLYVYGHWPLRQIDHIDGNGENNRLSNLRDVSQSTNQKNQKLKSNNTSGHVGVSWSNTNKKWVATLVSNLKTIYLGGYKDINDAVSARERGSIKYGFSSIHGKIDK